MKIKKAAVKIAAFILIVGSMAITAPAAQPQSVQSLSTDGAIITPSYNKVTVNFTRNTRSVNAGRAGLWN